MRVWGRGTALAEEKGPAKYFGHQRKGVKAKGNAYKVKENWSLISEYKLKLSDWSGEVIFIKDCLKGTSSTQLKKYSLDINF